jgi:hypothetical protein
MTTNNLYINCVHAEYSMIELFDLFYASGIATVSEIYYIPYYNSIGELCNHVYINIHNWHDTDYAYNFINKISKQPGESEARIVYHDDDWFPVTIAPLYRPYHGYSIVNYLLHTNTRTFQTLDLSTLKPLDKLTDLLTI